MTTLVGSLATRIAALVAALGRSWSLALVLDPGRRKPYPTLRRRRGPAPAQSTNVDILNAWEGTDRDPLKLSQDDRARITRDAIERAKGRTDLNQGALMLLIGGAWRRLIVERLSTGRTFPAPSPEWAARKRRLRLSPVHMRASGQLLSAVQRAQVVTRR